MNEKRTKVIAFGLELATKCPQYCRVKIALISDTHSVLDPKLIPYLLEVDEIWHAGDIGTIETLEALLSIKPTIAVYGNIDGGVVRQSCKEVAVFVRNEVKIMMVHIAGNPPRYNSTVLNLIRKHRPNLFVCGHSHILKVMPDQVNKLLFMNPGAAGNHGFHKMKTFLRFQIIDGKVKNLQAVELGKRGALK